MTDLLVRTLDLRADLAKEAEGRLTAYDLPEAMASTPSPDEEAYAGALAVGFAAESVPAGKYLFAQVQGAATPERVAEEALEQQREGLWRGFPLGARLYVRELAEERGIVRQYMRQLVDGEER